MHQPPQNADRIADELADLGRDVARQLRAALAALHDHDLAGADIVVKADSEINHARYAIESQVADELGRGSVESGRLRFLIAVLSVVNDLERMGDHAEGIAKVALMLGAGATEPVPNDLNRLGDMVIAMLERGMRAFRDSDEDDARQTCADDDAVDQLYDQMYSELLTGMAADPSSIIPRTYLLWVTHNLERIADRVTNVCERTVYLVTGRLDELNVSNY